METTRAEENYLKAILKIGDRDSTTVSTNSVAKAMQTSAASVTDMVKRLSDKGLVNYARYKGVTLTDSGRSLATNLVRRHRLWESFLVDKLDFKWNEVHDIAEELEHINSPELIQRLDAFLDHPRFDPHGDPIPSADGKFTLRKQVLLAELPEGASGKVVGVKQDSDDFLTHLDKIGLQLNTDVKVTGHFAYDDSVSLSFNGLHRTVSTQVAGNIYVKPIG